MAENKEESAIDVIYGLRDSFEFMIKKVNVIETNIKLMNNKISKINKALNNLKEQAPVVNTNVSTAPSDIIKSSGKEGGLVIGKIKTFGRIADRNRKPIGGVLVKVHNSDGDIIKTRQTDSDGYWDVRLPPGKYGVEYVHKGFKPINLTVTLTDDMETCEVK